ncbi:MAG: tetratricopeptide repeat protein [bacterium]
MKNYKTTFVLLLLVFMASSSTVLAQASVDTSKAKAINFLDKGNYQQAVDLLEGIKSQTEDKDIYLLLGIAYQKLGKYENAIESLKTFESKNPDTEEYRYYLGLSFYEQQKYKEAYSEFNKAEAAGVRPGDSAYYAGYIHFMRGEYNDALPYFIKVTKQEGTFTNLAHYYAGVCLYNQGFDDKAAFESAMYHFDKVTKDNSDLSQESRRYIEVIREYLNEGIARYKRRLDLKSKGDVFFTTNRTVLPVDGIPIIGISADTNRIAADFMFDIGFAPILTQNFAFFIKYGFSIDTALSTEIDYTNVQKHSPGLALQFFNQLRTWEVSLDYNYTMDFLDEDKVRKIDGAHVVSLSYENSITSSWALGLKIPFRMYKANGDILGSFEGKSVEFALSSYHLLKRSSFLFEPSVIIYTATSGVVESFKYYSLTAKLNLPWKLGMFSPSLKVIPGMISSTRINRKTFDVGMNLGASLGLGMNFNIILRAREGFLSDQWEFISGIGFEYLY